MRSKVFFPNQLVKLMLNSDRKLPSNQLAFRVAPSMTKNEIKEHLEKIYELPVEVSACLLRLPAAPSEHLGVRGYAHHYIFLLTPATPAIANQLSE